MIFKELKRFKEWLEESYKDSQQMILSLSSRKKFPFFIETLSLPRPPEWSLISLLKTYIQSATRYTEFEELRYGVRFVIIRSDKTTCKIFIWPQHILHDTALKIYSDSVGGDSKLYSTYIKLTKADTSSAKFLFAGVLLAGDTSMTSNMSIRTMNTLVKSLFPDFAKQMGLTQTSVRFYK